MISFTSLSYSWEPYIFLGHVISKNGIQVENKKVEVVAN